MFRKFFSGIFFFLLCSSLWAQPYQYPFPLNLDLAVGPAKPASITFPCDFIATVTGLVGNPTNLEVFFDSSPNLKVEPKSADIKGIGAGEKKSFNLKVERKEAKGYEGYTFVKLRVRYIPDFQKMREEFSNTGKYPSKAAREYALDSIKESADLNVPMTDVTEFIIREEPAPMPEEKK